MKYMMNRYFILFLSIISLCSCEDFLESRDKSQILENKLFVNQEGVEEAMYGIYYRLAHQNLYGARLSLLPDVMANCYYQMTYLGDLSSSTTRSENDYMVLHNKTNSWVRSHHSVIWSSSYEVISQINKVIERLNKREGNTLRHYDMYYGEALGLRAILHFELLRRYGSPNIANRGIPYVDAYGMYVTSFSTTGECYSKIIADLKKADTLLYEDKELMAYPRPIQNSYDPYTTDREFHINLYAVKALLARVYWTRNQEGDMDSAAYYAKQVIESDLFPLPNGGLEVGPQPFRLKMAGTVDVQEAIFGVYASDTYTNTADLYLSANSAYMPIDEEMYTIQNSALGTDWRSEWLREPNVRFDMEDDYGIRWMKLISPKQFNKDDEEVGVGSNGYNIIRIPEMYFILMESLLESDPEQALALYNTFIASRGLYPVEGPLTMEMIDDQVKKEFAQEGQYWFRLRRNQVETISVAPVVAARHSIYTLTMDEDKWTYWIPDGEFEFRAEGTY